MDWQFIPIVIGIIGILISSIGIWFAYQKYKEIKVSLKLFIKELKLYDKGSSSRGIALQVIVHFNNKGQRLIKGRSYYVEFDGVKLTIEPNGLPITKPEEIELRPKEQKDMSFYYVIKNHTIPYKDKNEWKKIGSGKKIRFIFKEDNSGKSVKSKRVKFEDKFKVK